jgi:hypothetical protein
MEVEGGAQAQGQISLNILQTIRTAQMQNGLKHGDYGRYRYVEIAAAQGHRLVRSRACAIARMRTRRSRCSEFCCCSSHLPTSWPRHHPPRVFCARRLRTLYKALKFLHGKGRYQKKKIEVAMVTDSRWVGIGWLVGCLAWWLGRFSATRQLPQ